MLADICMAWVNARCRRKLWAFGWPHMAIAFTSGDAERGRELLDRLRREYRAWLWLKTKAGHPMVDMFLRSSQFNSVAVVQLIHVCEQENWEFTERLLAFLVTRVGLSLIHI